MLWDLDVTKDDDSDTLDNNKLDKMEDIFNQVVDKYSDGIIYHYFPRGGNQIRSSYEVILKNQSPDDIIDIDKLSFYQQLGANNDEIAKEFPKNAVKYFIGSDYVYRFVVNPEERKQLKDFCKKYGYKIKLINSGISELVRFYNSTYK